MPTFHLFTTLNPLQKMSLKLKRNQHKVEFTKYPQTSLGSKPTMGKKKKYLDKGAVKKKKKKEI
jgi:hypothetical protein